VTEVHLGLGAVDDVIDVALGGVRHLPDPYRGVNETAQDRLLVDDFCVVARVGRDWNARQQRVQVRRTAESQQLAAFSELVSDRNGVGGFASPVEVDDGVVDLLMRGTVEVCTAEHLDDVGDRVLCSSAWHRAHTARPPCPAAASGRRVGLSSL
jgi:hypothetical protein